MRAAAILVLLGACYDGGYDIIPQASNSECYSFECGVMAGGEVRAAAVFESDTGPERLAVRGVSVSPPGLAAVSLDGDVIVLDAGSAPGLGVLHADLENGDAIDRDFTVAVRGSVAITPDSYAVPLELFPGGALPGGRLAMFGGDSLAMIAEFRDESGNRLLGHDDSGWTATNVQLAQLAPMRTAYDTDYDTSLERTVLTNDVGPAAVAFGSATLAIDVVPPRTTARIELQERYEGGTYDSLSIRPQDYQSFSVLAYAADGGYIYGATAFIPLVVMSSDPDIASVEIVSGSARELSVHGYRSGTATLSISFDGQAITLPVTVE